MRSAPRPRPWNTGDAHSFAHRTLAVRVPKILDDTVTRAQAAGILSDEARANLAALRDELTQGSLRALVDEASDVAAWNVACAPHVGRSWLEIPWYFAESYFYRRILEATGFFRRASAMFGVDPFGPIKHEEEATAFPKVRALLEKPAAIDLVLHRALWGNRADLSYTAGLAHGAAGDADDLLVDDTVRALDALTHAKRVAMLLDNAGTELANDLVLAAELNATVFAKSHPFFVSDATPDDVTRTASALGLALPETIAHPYMTSSGFFFVDEMPADLVATLRAFDVVIVKGDANYRRLVGDAPWPHTTPIAQASAFPTTFLALRTLKAEVAVGLDNDVVTQAKARDPEWLVSGRFGVIQLCEAESNGKGP